MIPRFPVLSTNSFTLNEQSDKRRMSLKQASFVLETSDIVHLGVKYAPKFAGKHSREASQEPISPVEVKNENSGSESPKANSSKKRRKLSPSRMSMISGGNFSPFKKSSTGSRSISPSSPKSTGTAVKLTTRRRKLAPGEKKQARLRPGPLSRFRRLVQTADKSKDSVALAQDWNEKGKAGETQYQFGRDLSYIDIQNARQYNAEKANLPTKLIGYLSGKPKPSDDQTWVALAEQCKKDLKLKHPVSGSELQRAYASLQPQPSMPGALNPTVSNSTLGYSPFHPQRAPRMGYMGPGAQFSTPVPSTYDGMSSFTGQQRMITAKTDLYPPGMPPSQVSYQTQALIQRNNQPGFYDALSPYSSQHALPMGMQQQRGNWYGHVTEPLMDFSSMQSKMLPEISDSDFKFDLTDINLDFRSPSSEAKSPAVKSEKSGISSSRLSEGPKPFTNTRQGSTSVKPKKRRVRRVGNNERPRLEQAVKTYTGTLQGRELCKHFKSTLGLATTPKPYDLANIRAKFKKGPQIGLKTEPSNSASPNTGLEQSHINMPGSPLDDWGDFFKSGDNQHTSSLESKTALGQSYGGFNFTGDASNAFEFDAAALPPTSQSHEFGLISQQPQMPRQFYPTPLPAPAAIHPPASLLAPGWGLSGNNSLSQSQRMPTNSSNTGFPVWDTVGGFPNSYSVNDVTSQQRMQGGGQYPQDKTFSPFHGLPQVPSNANSAFSNLGGEGYSAHDFEAFIKSLERHSPRP